jgi:hypothetical protein
VVNLTIVGVIIVDAGVIIVVADVRFVVVGAFE